MKITVCPSAVSEFKTIPECVRLHLIDVIKREAPRASTKPLVIGWTMDGNRPHIFRVIKDYVYSPGHRVIFHCTADGISIDRVAARCDDPYMDGH